MSEPPGPSFALETWATQQPPGKGIRRLEYRLPCRLCGKPSQGIWMQGHITGGVFVGLCHEHAPNLRDDT